MRVHTKPHQGPMTAAKDCSSIFLPSWAWRYDSCIKRLPLDYHSTGADFPKVSATKLSSRCLST